MKKAITVLAPSFIITYILAVAAGLGQIAQAFPDRSESAVQLLTSLPSLIALYTASFDTPSSSAT